MPAEVLAGQNAHLGDASASVYQRRRFDYPAGSRKNASVRRLPRSAHCPSGVQLSHCRGPGGRDH